jgi:hypothetical protein
MAGEQRAHAMIDDLGRAGTAEKATDRLAIHHARRYVDRTPRLSSNRTSLVVQREKTASRIDRLGSKEREKRICFVPKPATMVGIVEPGFPSLSAFVIHRLLTRSTGVFGRRPIAIARLFGKTAR